MCFGRRSERMHELPSGTDRPTLDAMREQWTPRAAAAVTSQWFTCENCGGRFLRGWTDEEANAEAVANFGALPAPEDQALICDDCYTPFIAWAREQGLAADA